MSYGNWDIELGGIRVTTDEWQFIVHHWHVPTKGKNAGEGYWLAKTYHTTVEGLANELLRLKLRGECIKGVDDVTYLASVVRATTAHLTRELREKL